MALVITDLSIDRRQTYGDIPFCVNFVSDDVSTITTIKAGMPEKRIWIDKIKVTPQSSGTEWFKLYNGNDTLLGPIVVQDGIPWEYTPTRGVNLALGNDLRIKTKSAIGIHVIVDGIVDINPDTSISSSASSSPSASPSEGS